MPYSHGEGTLFSGGGGGGAESSERVISKMLEKLGGQGF